MQWKPWSSALGPMFFKVYINDEIEGMGMPIISVDGTKLAWVRIANISEDGFRGSEDLDRT